MTDKTLKKTKPGKYFGHVHDYDTGEELRLATKEEARMGDKAAGEAPYTGVFLDGKGRRVFVQRYGGAASEAEQEAPSAHEHWDVGEAPETLAQLAALNPEPAPKRGKKAAKKRGKKAAKKAAKKSSEKSGAEGDSKPAKKAAKKRGKKAAKKATKKRGKKAAKKATKKATKKRGKKAAKAASRRG